MGCVGSGKIDVHLWFWIWGGCFRLHLGQRDKKKLIASDQAAIFEGKCWVSLAGYPSSCSPNITPFCPIQPLYNPYIGGILLVYMSRTLPRVPNFFHLKFQRLVYVESLHEHVEAHISMIVVMCFWPSKLTRKHGRTGVIRRTRIVLRNEHLISRLVVKPM